MEYDVKARANNWSFGELFWEALYIKQLKARLWVCGLYRLAQNLFGDFEVVENL